MSRAQIMTETTTSKTQTVSEDQVKQVAALANVELTAEELPAMGRDLNAILDYIAQLNELDKELKAGNVAPMAQVSELIADVSGAVPDATGAAETPLRDDKLVPCLEREPVMASAPETDGAFFKVPRVIER